MTKTNPASTLSTGKKTATLPQGDEPEKLTTGDDLALEALSHADDDSIISSHSSQLKSKSKPEYVDETDESNELATTLLSLQMLVERQANQLIELGKKIKEKNESLRGVFSNDTKLTEAEDEMETFSQAVKARKSQMDSSPQVVSLKVQLGELKEQKKELEETISNHLVNYHQLTNSTSFDTSDGDQWEFVVKARIKPRRKK